MLTRPAPFGTATLIDEDWRVDFARETTPTDVVTVVAIRPLTRDETWIDLARNEVLILRDGAPLRKRQSRLEGEFVGCSVRLTDQELPGATLFLPDLKDRNAGVARLAVAYRISLEAVTDNGKVPDYRDHLVRQGDAVEDGLLVD